MGAKDDFFFFVGGTIIVGGIIYVVSKMQHPVPDSGDVLETPESAAIEIDDTDAGVAPIPGPKPQEGDAGSLFMLPFAMPGKVRSDVLRVPDKVRQWFA